ncbi:MAG: IS4 family transposase [Myxacorys chilensis ATA2-1-KO14]|nr:IS4 family transposase [Myxacorys chilensis ATA2-1-KO14]
MSPTIEAGQVFKAIENAIPIELIHQMIAKSNCQSQRQRKLPAHLVVCLVIAFSFWSSAAMRDVLKNLVDGLSVQWTRLSQYWKVPNSASISEARARLGCQVMRQLFVQVARPLATPETPGAFLGGLRLMAVDGTLLDVPDTPSNARVFGYPGSRFGNHAAFPKVRLVLLIEAGTHLITDALICPYRMGERRRALKLLRCIGAGMLLMWDRGLHSFRMVQTTLIQGGHYLGRVPANVKFEVEQVLGDDSYLSWIYPDRKSKKKGATRIQVRVIEYTIEATGQSEQPLSYRLVTSLLDAQAFPALLLAQQYHQRWEIETTLDEVKTHLLGRKVPIRSLKPREVVQEIYGVLLGHWAVRSLMVQAAQLEGISPLRLSFTGTLQVLRRAVAKFQSAATDELPLFGVG